MEKKQVISAIADAWILESRPRNILDDSSSDDNGDNSSDNHNVSVSI